MSQTYPLSSLVSQAGIRLIECPPLSLTEGQHYRMVFEQNDARQLALENVPHRPSRSTPLSETVDVLSRALKQALVILRHPAYGDWCRASAHMMDDPSTDVWYRLEYQSDATLFAQLQAFLGDECQAFLNAVAR